MRIKQLSSRSVLVWLMRDTSEWGLNTEALLSMRSNTRCIESLMLCEAS